MTNQNIYDLMTEIQSQKTLKNKFGHKMAASEKSQKMRVLLSCIHMTHLQVSIHLFINLFIHIKHKSYTFHIVFPTYQ